MKAANEVSFPVSDAENPTVVYGSLNEEESRQLAYAEKEAMADEQRTSADLSFPDPKLISG